MYDENYTTEPYETEEATQEASEQVEVSVQRISSSDSNGFKAVILDLIGDYEMVTKEYTYTGTNGYTTKQVTTEPDYAWMCSAAIFIIVLFCFLRILGGVICAKRN